MTSPLVTDPDNTEAMADLKVTAATLLLRSPRLSLSQILELLDIGDAEFRTMTRESPQIQTLLDQRRDGTLPEHDTEMRTCPSCDEWFLPYAGSRYCSDECRRIDRINGPRKV